jgi:hypothetical protein
MDIRSPWVELGNNGYKWVSAPTRIISIKPRILVDAIHQLWNQHIGFESTGGQPNLFTYLLNGFGGVPFPRELFIIYRGLLSHPDGCGV